MHKILIRNCFTAILLLFPFIVPVNATEKKVSFEVQALLNALGYEVGVVDGKFGNKSRKALSKFQEFKGKPSSLTLNNDTVELLKNELFGQGSRYKNYGWNGNFIVPLEVLEKLSSTNTDKIESSCGGNANWQRKIIKESLSSQIPRQLVGFNSRMDNQSKVKHADELDQFVLSFSRLSSSYIALENKSNAELALQGLYYWAQGGAFLDTVECTVSGRLDNKKCTEWTEPTGQDLSLIKDHHTVQMHMMHLSYGYYMGLVDYEKDNERHSVVKKWFRAFYSRNKLPDSEPYFGLDHGWYWPAIMQNQLEGRSSVSLIKRLISQLDREIFQDGSIKNRTTRGNKALWYHHDGMKEIMITLEIARRHGISIPPSLNEKVKKAGEIFIQGFKDHSYLDKWAKVAHNSIYVEGEQEFKENINQIPNGNSWFHIYAYRYPKSEITKQLYSLLNSSNNDNSASKDAMIGFGLGCLYSAITEF